MPKFTLDILYILLDYCDPFDTNIMTVIDVLADSSEKEFDKFIKYSIQKSKRESFDKTKNIAEILKKERVKQLKQFEKMKKDNNYKSFHSYDYKPYINEFIQFTSGKVQDSQSGSHPGLLMN